MINKTSDLILAGCGLLSLLMFDVTIDVVLSVLHGVFELLHFCFEWFEMGVEHAVEHLFHTSRHGSQIITFYLLMALAGWIGYRLWRILRRLFKTAVDSARQAWERGKTAGRIYWRSLSMGGKLKLCSSVISAAYLASFFCDVMR
ncbi:hypothetical protein NP590_19290 [Methylomonas sp. SURF-2]|uniref:Uncharacterized protein n=1 Tax=Methylomonas subterranea TaxID=2952225 RepID=A0ABT1TMD2_9GAMM|nr:hypothetical protein [Methylomonas sp. SURF-2]MCQ8106262.1 hypothetical protein [Methylomonas sp. SURF-2]